MTRIPSPRRTTLALPLLLMAALAALLATAAQATMSPQEFVAKLNAQRVANGIPGGIVEDPTWSYNCHLHNVYSALNGGWDADDPHDETPGKPGYTQAGAMAARGSNLARGEIWPGRNPWETAPMHLALLLNPQLNRVGFDAYRDFMCGWVGGVGYGSPSDRIYTYPGDDTEDVYYAERTQEAPTDPAAAAGLMDTNDTPAGPYIIILPDGPWIFDLDHFFVIDAATLTGPDGAVAIARLDANSDPK
jgi:hypothetical protein